MKMYLEACSPGAEMSMPGGRVASVLEQMPEHEVAGRQVGSVERREQAQPPADPGRGAAREVCRRLGRRDDHRAGEREHQDRQRGLPGAAAHGEQAEEAAQDAEPGDTKHGGEQKQCWRGTDGQPEQHDYDAGRHDQEHDQLHERGGRLAQVHRTLVHRREQQALKRIIRGFVLIRPVAQTDGGEQGGEPQQRRCRLGEEQPVRSQGEAEREQHRGRERKHRAHRGPGAHFGPQILGDDRLGDPEAHDGATPAGVITWPPSIITSRSRRCAGGASWLATTTVRPSACAVLSRPSTTTRASTSNAAYGSSSSMSAGARITHRARVSRWRMPCEKRLTRTVATSSRPTRPSAGSASRGSMPYRVQAKRRFSAAVRSPYKRVSWLSRSVRARMALRSVRRSKPSTLPSPKVGEMAVAINRSSVVFPDPFQPRSHTVSPMATSRLTLLTAARPSNSLVTLDRRTAARPGAVIGAFWALDVRSRRPRVSIVTDDGR